MENQILLDIRSMIDSGLVTEIFGQNSPVSSENFNLESAAINNPIEEGLLSNQDNVCAVGVGEALIDHFKYPLTAENQNPTGNVEVQPHGSISRDDDDLEKYKELNLPEEAYLPSSGVHLLSSVAMQYGNRNVPTLSIFSPEGTVNQNVRMIPVFRSFMPPVAGENKCICYDQFKGIQTSTMHLQNLTNCLNGKCPNDACGLPQTSASVYDEITEAREAVSSAIENYQDRAIFQSSNVDESGYKLLALHSVAEESRCSDPVVICQLEGGTQILCMNSCSTQELKPVQLIPEYPDPNNYLQSDVDNSVTAVLGQFLPVPDELVVNEQEFENGPLQPVASTAAFHLESGQHGPVKITAEGLSFGSEVTKPKKSCNCTKSLCLKLYYDCFANGDFCNNCNCNNCYNNQLHETDQFKAIELCLDRNPEAFLTKIGKRKLGEIRPHHNKGCNCKLSGCLKNYCECFEAKMTCSSICKCIDCKNFEESPAGKNQLNVLNCMEIVNNEGNSSVLTPTFKTLPKLKKDRPPAVCISWEEVKAVCAYLLVQAEEAEKRGYSGRLAERMIMEEFGRCLSQILH
ncbi:MTL5 protein, partial [Syrrhaptes paradoxus]|nr:MTL5 protein [Syrrhaptes paradoxus]